MTDRLHVTPIGDDGIYILDTASWRVHRPVLNKEKCVQCGMCMAYCPVNSIIGKENNTYEISYDYCKGCGICAYECKSGAIDMVLEGGAK